MFTKNMENMLKIETTDYEIDQVANSIECMSDEQYSKNKMILWDEIKYAKQLSQFRNLLQNGDFEELYGFGKNGWTISNNITIQADNPIFKGHYLHMSGAKDIDGTVFPTYIYQKIDESKLKPYTRYQVRGFVGSSKDLGLVVTRYGKEVNVVMNPEYNTPVTDGYTSDTCSCQPNLEKKHVVCHDYHQFKFHIDIGQLNMSENIGIWVLFKISSPDGFATLDNLEVIEEGSITGETLEHVKQREKKWNYQMEKKRMETQQAYNQAKQAIDILFTSTQELQYDVTLNHIKNAERLVQSIPYVYNTWLRTVPGMNYDLYTDLTASIAQAHYLYDARNVITNSDFTQGLLGWHVTGKVEVQQMNGTSVLVLSNWSAGVSQDMHIQHSHRYVLRVIAKKEGFGKGYVMIKDCDENQETLTFTSCEEGYITKTVEIFPENDRVQIEIGENEGLFYIESIELICMKG
ncbi:hypothetical protein [Paenibacillus sp. IHBB 10380]|uniref:hypothetical protein n=1 Tax=Paenibacillus sp. IHBB 10380 TaxID=1566358 RepID=UPI0005CF93FC|nr:hypothetical protein [Paenibacillus sp. IHBB 10380]AJS57595.1 pesticidial crystal protein [Paenibacillus sp. IHBB 10380]